MCSMLKKKHCQRAIFCVAITRLYAVSNGGNFIPPSILKWGCSDSVLEYTAVLPTVIEVHGRKSRMYLFDSMRCRPGADRNAPRYAPLWNISFLCGSSSRCDRGKASCPLIHVSLTITIVFGLPRDVVSTADAPRS